MDKSTNNSIRLPKPEDGYSYFLLHIFDYFPYIVLNLIGSVFGILGNILIIGSIICTKKLHTIANIIIANLC